MQKRSLTLNYKVLCMSQNEPYQKDLESIRQLMERSVKFLSLSGLSGILAGLYALVGAAVAYFMVHFPMSPVEYRQESLQGNQVILKLLGIAVLVLVVSLITGYVLANQKAKKKGVKVWNTTSRRLVVNLAIPLVTGALFILILLWNGHYGVAAPACLVFYGLALLNASAHLFDEIRYLGYSEIVLGLICALLPGYGLIFWAVGFGVLHILYGTLMYKKYDR
ncbi:MAG: membrane protein [Bacteroidetes bacterium OLB12]|nr:MAG: membrane protein [Bacteroidetes bacterium OLB12]